MIDLHNYTLFFHDPLTTFQQRETLIVPHLLRLETFAFWGFHPKDRSNLDAFLKIEQDVFVKHKCPQ